MLASEGPAEGVVWRSAVLLKDGTFWKLWNRLVQHVSSGVFDVTEVGSLRSAAKVHVGKLGHFPTFTPYKLNSALVGQNTYIWNKKVSSETDGGNGCRELALVDGT
ncbi:hypothetical protein AVEN_98571-1 [Araneus ventricosus]|uniref:Uncharacterized protein n=1 Tax=Araneus ventricosus TaxID=182803 RepID=A0A4Y2LE03_ARAVE|nr:hypothetical protein AVEN_98571-1 [Araneus ventricosus]